MNRSEDQWTRPFLHHGGVQCRRDLPQTVLEPRYELAGQLAVSRVAGSSAAILRTQRNPVHYYQQPGDDVDVDSTRESLSGYSAQLKLGKYSGGITRFETSIVRMSPGFEANDLGFLRRADLLDWSTWAALSAATSLLTSSSGASGSREGGCTPDPSTHGTRRWLN